MQAGKTKAERQSTREVRATLRPAARKLRRDRRNKAQILKQIKALVFEDNK